MKTKNLVRFLIGLFLVSVAILNAQQIQYKIENKANNINQNELEQESAQEQNQTKEDNPNIQVPEAKTLDELIEEAQEAERMQNILNGEIPQYDIRNAQ